MTRLIASVLFAPVLCAFVQIYLGWSGLDPHFKDRVLDALGFVPMLILAAMATVLVTLVVFTATRLFEPPLDGRESISASVLHSQHEKSEGK